MKKLIASKASELRNRFWKNDKGSMTAMMGLSMLGLCVATGAAIDYGRVVAAQQRLAVSMDAAVLHVANLTGKTEAQLQTIAYENLMANYGSDTYDEVSGFTLTAPPGSIKANANVRVRTWFMSIVGYKFMDIPIKAEAVRGGKNIEVALVLDNTGSMLESAGGGLTKMQSLISAANSFVDKVIADPAGQTPFYSKAAIVPYSETVNPGTLLGTARLAVTASGSCGAKQWSCATWRVNSSKTYNLAGCVQERQVNAFTDADITTNRAMYNYDDVCLNAQVRLLTDSKADLHATINSMTANGGTGGHIGIQWGYQMLAPGSGLSAAAGDTKAKPGVYGDEKIKKIMIIMTDGAFNTWHCNGVTNNGTGGCNNPNGNSFAQAMGMCNNIKSKDIEVYFVAVGLVPDANINALTAACSTDATHIIMASDGAALNAAFETIAANIRALRLSM